MKKLLVALFAALALSLSSSNSSGQAAPAITGVFSLSPVPLGVGTTVAIHVDCSSCGNVQMFVNGATVQGPAPVNSTGDITYPIYANQLPSTGTYQVLLKYAGNGSYGSNQTTLSLSVIPNTNPTPAINSSLSLNPVPLGVGTTVSATVACAPNCGQLQMFLNSKSVFGPSTLGSNGAASYNIPAYQLPSTGTYQLSLNYLGNGTTAPNQSTLSINVVPNPNSAPNMTAALSLNPVPLGVGTTVTVNVPCTPCGTVQIILNGTSVFGPGGSGNSSLYIPAWRLPSTGNYHWWSSTLLTATPHPLKRR